MASGKRGPEAQVVGQRLTAARQGISDETVAYLEVTPKQGSNGRYFSVIQWKI